jgi:hypothetical protein
MREALKAVAAVHPEARIVLGAFAPGKTRPTRPAKVYEAINMVDYVDLWYENGYGNLCPGPWSIHPYSSPDGLDAREPWSIMTTQFEAIRDVLVAEGQAMKLVWGTEYGFTTQPNDAGGRPQLSEAQQAEKLVKQTSQWMNKRGAGPGFVFTWRDFRVSNGVNGLGINTDRTSTNPNGRPKMARAALRELLT